MINRDSLRCLRLDCPWGDAHHLHLHLHILLEYAGDPQNVKLYTTIAGPAGSCGTANCRWFSLNNAGASHDVVLYMLGKLEMVCGFPRFLPSTRSLADDMR
jgi:hypothetical protein